MEDRLILLAEERLKQTDYLVTECEKKLNSLSEYEDLKICVSKPSSGRERYYIRARGGNMKNYVEHDSDQLKKIRDARFCREMQKAADLDRRLLSSLISGYVPLDNDTINNRLPASYRKSGGIIVPTKFEDNRANEWIERMERDRKKVRSEPKYQDDLRHNAGNGLIVRSKSELTIASILRGCNVPFVYEFPYILGGEIFSFDFTILSKRDYKTQIIIEHQGMMSEQWYCDKYMYSLKACLEYGIVPNVDIFFTFDDLQGNFDATQIWNILQAHVL